MFEEGEKRLTSLESIAESQLKFSEVLTALISLDTFCIKTESICLPGMRAIISTK